MAIGLAIRQPFDRSAFLAWEDAQPDRWELVGGIIRMMAGGTVDHNTVAGNIYAFLHSKLRGGPCRPFQQNMKLTPAENEDSTYPDVLVICRPDCRTTRTAAFSPPWKSRKNFWSMLRFDLPLPGS